MPLPLGRKQKLFGSGIINFDVYYEVCVSINQDFNQFLLLILLSSEVSRLEIEMLTLLYELFQSLFCITTNKNRKSELAT